MSLPKPFYDEGGITIYHGDCREILPQLDKPELLLTDPPYGISLPTNYAKTRRAAEAKDKRRHAWPCREHAEGIVGDDRAFDPAFLLSFPKIMLWGAQNYADKLPPRYSWLAWDKRDNRGAKCNLGDCELCWCFGVPFNSVRMFHHLWIGYQRDSEVGERVLHPTQKPVSLMEWCIEMAGSPTSLADPFMGSGTTLVAAKLRGLRAIGIEINKDYCEVAVARLSQGVLLTC